MNSTAGSNEEIFDKDEFEKALAWTKKYCKEGKDLNMHPHSGKQKDKEWETVVKMTLIARDLMVGNPRACQTRIRRRSSWA